MGSWAPDSLKFMKDLGSRVTEATGEQQAKSFLGNCHNSDKMNNFDGIFLIKSCCKCFINSL